MWWLAIGGGTPAFAQSAEPDPFSAADLGTGGAIRANPGAPGAALSSPAVLALSPRYEVTVGGRLGSSRVRRVEASAVDSATGPVTLGAAFIRESFIRDATTEELPGWLEPGQDILNPQTHTVIGGGLAFSLLDRHLAAGAGLRYRLFTSRFVDSDHDYQIYASVAAKPHDNVYLSLGAEDLLPAPLTGVLAPTLAAAARWEIPQAASLEVDLLTVLDPDAGVTPDILAAGAELWASDNVPLRFGYRRDIPDGTDTFTAGFGAHSEQVSLNYAASLTRGSWEHAHALSIRLFF